MSLLCIEVPLTALAAAPALPNLGRFAYGLLLRLVAVADAATAAHWHGDAEVKPFTVALLPDGTGALLRVTTLTSAAGHLVAERVLPALPSTLELGGSGWAVAGAPRQHAVRYEDLVQRFLFAPQAPRRIRLRFLTPTTFRSQGRAVPLPLPGLVFGSLVDRWNALAPTQLPPDARQVIDERVVVCGYRLATHVVELAGGKHVAFAGECAYQVVPPDPYWARVLLLLAEFAGFAGVGAKTTMGLGQARRLGKLG